MLTVVETNLLAFRPRENMQIGKFDVITETIFELYNSRCLVVTEGRGLKLLILRTFVTLTKGVLLRSTSGCHHDDFKATVTFSHSTSLELET